MQSVYLDNTLGFHRGTGNNLKTLVQLYDNGERSASTISAILASLGIPKENLVPAVAQYMTNPYSRPEHSIEKYTKNLNLMPFTLSNLATLLGDVKTSLDAMSTSNVNTINYSVGSSTKVVESLIQNIFEIQKLKASKLDESADIHSNTRVLLDVRPEFYFLNESYNSLNKFKDLVPIKDYLAKANFLLRENFYTNHLSNLTIDLLNENHSSYYSEAISDIKFLLENDEKYIKSNVAAILNKHSWIPKVSALLEMNARETSKLVSNSNATVSKVYSPIQLNEDGSYIFVLNNRFYKANKNSTLEIIKNPSSISEKLYTLANVVKDFKIDENSLTIYKAHDELKILFEKESIEIAGQKISKSNLEGIKDSLTASGFFRLDEGRKINETLMILENFKNIVQLDIVTSIEAPNGNIVNLIKLSESSIYINRINENTLINELFRAEDSRHAQQLVNEYVNYDISNSIATILAEQDAKLLNTNNDIATCESRISFLQKELARLDNANKDHLNPKLNEASELLMNEVRKFEIDLQKLYKFKSELV